MVEVQEIMVLRIIVGRVYRYIDNRPKGCKGGLYRVVQFIQDVPSYQEKILVKCIQGQDEGIRFVCTPTNFSQRYEPLVVETEVCDPPIDASIPVREGWTADFSTKGSGT